MGHYAPGGSGAQHMSVENGMQDLSLWRQEQIRALKRDLESLFVRLCYDFGPGSLLDIDGSPPFIDLREDRKAISITAEIPDLDPESLEISLENDTLSLRGRRVKESFPGRQQVTTRTAFSTTLRLPAQVDPEAVKATLTEGRLYIVLPKIRPGGRQIPITQE